MAPKVINITHGYSCTPIRSTSGRFGFGLNRVTRTSCHSIPSLIRINSLCFFLNWVFWLTGKHRCAVGICQNTLCCQLAILAMGCNCQSWAALTGKPLVTATAKQIWIDTAVSGKGPLSPAGCFLNFHQQPTSIMVVAGKMKIRAQYYLQHAVAMQSHCAVSVRRYQSLDATLFHARQLLPTIVQACQTRQVG